MMILPRVSRLRLSTAQVSHQTLAEQGIVPADDKENARLIVSQIVLDTLEGLKMAYPNTSEERRKELLSILAQLEQ